MVKMPTIFKTLTWEYKLSIPVSRGGNHEMSVIVGTDKEAFEFVEEHYGKKAAEGTVIVSKESND